MAKVSPVSIKYMIHANLTAEGALEKPDVIGALFGQTEGLLGSELEMRELQREGKIGRIEVDIERRDKNTFGIIKIPTALDQSETTLIAAAIETIDRVGPCDAQIEVERIEDVRGSKREYIVERAKKLMQEIKGSADSREISKTIRESARVSEVREYGKSKLPYGDLSQKELIVVEGRADVLNLLRNGVVNCIAMNGTKLPDEIKGLGIDKEITLFVDGDRGGELIVKNVIDNAKIAWVAMAPEGREVEELTGKEILMKLRKKIRADEFLQNMRNSRNGFTKKKFELDEETKEKLKGIFESIKDDKKALILDSELNKIRDVSIRAVSKTLRNVRKKPKAIIINGQATESIIRSAEKSGCEIVVAKNFATTQTGVNLLSF